MQTHSLPEVDCSALSKRVSTREAVDETSSVVNSDYGAPNLLFLYYVPFLPDNLKLDLDALKDEFQSWNAWELSQAESQLKAQLDKDTLPSDGSTTSRVRRINYRIKVISLLRESYQTSWLSTTGTNSTDPLRLEVRKNDLNSTLRRILHNRYPTAPSQTKVAFNLISDNFSRNPVGPQQYLLTNVFYYYNSDLRVFQPDVQVFSFDVSQEALAGTTDSVTLHIQFLDFRYRLDRAAWRRFRPEAEDIIAQGEVIRKDMGLDFYWNQ